MQNFFVFIGLDISRSDAWRVFCRLRRASASELRAGVTNLDPSVGDVPFVSLFVIRRYMRGQLFTFRHLAQAPIFSPLPPHPFYSLLTSRPICKETE
jgi:hypothetical protein